MSSSQQALARAEVEVSVLSLLEKEIKRLSALMMEAGLEHSVRAASL